MTHTQNNAVIVRNAIIDALHSTRQHNPSIPNYRRIHGGAMSGYNSRGNLVMVSIWPQDLFGEFLSVVALSTDENEFQTFIINADVLHSLSITVDSTTTHTATVDDIVNVLSNWRAHNA